MEPRQPIMFLASERQYLDHLWPVIVRMPDVPVAVHTSLADRAPGARWLFDDVRDLAGEDCPRLVVAAACRDMDAAARHLNAKVAVVEHGAVPTYTPHQGMPGRRGITGSQVLGIMPGPALASSFPDSCPDVPYVTVGTPKLDRWAGYTPTGHEGRRPVVALSGHWEDTSVPHTSSAWPHYESAIPALLQEGWEVIGHGHPRNLRLPELWAEHGIEYVKEFDDVLARADVYVCDSSSTMYEFAATGRPVVALNAPWYDRSYSPGWRFWEHVPGVQVDEPDQLVATIHRALANDPDDVAERTSAVEAVYGQLVDGHAAERFELALRTLMECDTLDADTVARAMQEAHPDWGQELLQLPAVGPLTRTLLRKGVLVRSPEGDLLYMTRTCFQSHFAGRGWRIQRDEPA